jgi:hypothetical protein
MGTGISLGIGIPFRRMGAGIDAQAQAHYNRVIADGGLIPSGLVGVNNFFKTVKAIYGTSDITTAISVGLDAQVLGYKLGAGAGTTAGQAAQKLYSCSGSSGDVVQTTAASQPLLLVHSGANYWFGSGVSNNYVSTPNAAANQITGDIEIIAKVIITNQSTTQTIIAKNVDGSNFSYWFGLSAGNQLRFIFSQNGISTITATSTATQPFSITDIGFVKITKVSATGIVKFYTSTDGVTFTQLGSDVASTSGAMYSGNASVKTGAYDTANLFPFFGKIYRATISNSIGGAPVVDFNPNSYNAATSQTQWTSSTGEVWTINTGTATTGYKGVLVDRTIVQGDGINDFLTTDAAITLITSYEQFASFNGFNNQAKYLLGVCDSGAAKNNYLIELSTNTINWAFGDGTNQRYGTNSFTYNSLNIANLQYIQGNNFISTKKNNGATITNTGMFGAATTIAGASARLSLFRAGEFNGAYANGIINTLLLSVNGTTQQQTDMYGYIKSINNNAF